MKRIFQRTSLAVPNDTHMIKFILPICLAMLVATGLRADNMAVANSRINKLIELKKIKDPVEKDTQLIHQYNLVSEELARHQDDRSEAYLDTLRRLSELSDWDKAYGYYYRAVGRYHDFRGEFSDALAYYDKAIQSFKPAKGELKDLAFSYVLKGFLLSNSGMQQECWKVLEEGIPYAEKTDYKNSLCLMIDWFGDYYFYGLADTTNNKLALDYYLQVNELLPQINYARIIAGNHSGLSGVYYRLGRSEESEFHFQKADSLCIENGLFHMRWGLYSEKARVLERQGKHLEANEIYVFIESFMEETNDIEWKARLEKALYNNYKAIGNSQKALHHLELLNEMDEKMAVEEVQSKYAEIEAKYEFEKKENEITRLESSRSLLARNLAMGMLLLTIFGGLIIYRKNKNLHNANLKLEKRQEEIQQAFYTGEKEERQRLAGELHDNVNTKLAAARWQLEAITDNIESAHQKTIIDKTILMMNEAYQDVRNISHNLLPVQLDTEGLVPSIKELVDNLNSGGKTKFKFEHNDFIENEVSDIKYPLYNIIYELVNNIIKHAKAQAASIKLTTSDKELIIDVSDNGKGYSTDKNKFGFGLRSIINRVESLHGQFNVESGENQGTITNITIPIST